MPVRTGSSIRMQNVRYSKYLSQGVVFTLGNDCHSFCIIMVEMVRAEMTPALCALATGMGIVL